MFATGKDLVAALLPLVLGVAAACGGDNSGDDDGSDAGNDAGAGPWEVVQQGLPGALFSIWGTASDDIWAAGSDTGLRGPLVEHYDGTTWRDLDTGMAGDLWWVFGFPGGPVYLGGSGGTILLWQDGQFTRMATPTQGVTVFGIWGCSPDDVWAVGGEEGGQRGGFAWRLQGDTWLPADGFPAEVGDADAVWKVYGRSCDDVWMVGTAGLAIAWDGQSFGAVQRVAGASLFTVHASSDRFVAVGGGIAGGLVVENGGSGWADASPSGIDRAVGVCLTEDGGFASGWYGMMLVRQDGEWTPEDTGLVLEQTLHSVWVDPDGGVWAVGGQVLAPPFDDGVMIHRPP